jgi:hypothetical protein
MVANAAKLPLTNIYVDYELKNEKIALVNPGGKKLNYYYLKEELLSW